MTTRPRGFIVVTGSELVRGERRDLNGPFLAAELLRLGVEPARISIVGDREEELSDALAEGLGAADLCVVSGGLGPTHDDRTVELVARAAGVAAGGPPWCVAGFAVPRPTGVTLCGSPRVHATITSAVTAAMPRSVSNTTRD